MFPRAGAPETVTWLDDANKTVFTLEVELNGLGTLKVTTTRAGEGEPDGAFVDRKSWRKSGKVTVRRKREAPEKLAERF